MVCISRNLRVYYILQCTKEFEEQLKKEREEKESALNRLKSIGEEHQKQVEDMMKGLDEQHKLVNTCFSIDKFLISDTCTYTLVNL